MANLTAAISLMPISGCARLLGCGCINKIPASTNHHIYAMLAQHQHNIASDRLHHVQYVLSP